MTITQSGTSITFNDATVQTTAFSGNAVTSVATGNGLSGGPITTTGTLTVACPTAGSVGSYIFAATFNTAVTYGSNYSGSTIQGYTQNSDNTTANQFTPSGTWKWLGASTSVSGNFFGIACRVA